MIFIVCANKNHSFAIKTMKIPENNDNSLKNDLYSPLYTTKQVPVNNIYAANNVQTLSKGV